MRRSNLLYLAGMLVIALGLMLVPKAGWAAYGDYLSTISTGSLNQPTKVAVDQANGDVYVTDAGNKAVKKYDKTGALVTGFSLSVSGTPVGIAVNSTNIFVGDSTNKCVWIYNKSGALTDLAMTGSSHKLGGASGTSLRMPNTVTIATSGHIFVVDGDNDKVRIYNADGSANSSFGVSGSATSSGTTINLYYPSGLAMANSTTDVNNNVTQYFYIGDQGNSRVQKLFYIYGKYSKTISTMPTYSLSIGTKGDAFGQFLRISDVAWSTSKTNPANPGSLYVVDSLQMVVQRFESDITTNAAFNYAAGAVQGYLNIPTGSAVDTLNQKIYVANNQGASVALFSTGIGTAPSVTVDSPATLNIPVSTNPYVVNYSAGDTDSTATLYLFYDTNTSWGGGSNSITPGTGEYLIGSASVAQGAPAAGTYNWQVLYATPGTYYVRGIAVDADGNSAEAYSAGTVIIADSGDGLNTIFKATYGCVVGANDDPDNDGLTNLQEQTAGTNPCTRDTDSGGVSDGVEVAKGGNPNDSVDDMDLTIDKYGTFFADNDGYSETWFYLKNDGAVADVCDLTFEEWGTTNKNTVSVNVPGHGLTKFRTRDKSSILYGCMKMRSIQNNFSGYYEIYGLATPSGPYSTDEAVVFQDATFASNINLVVPVVNDGQDASGWETYLILLNLDKADSTGTVKSSEWGTANVQSWTRSVGALNTDVFRPAWITQPAAFPYMYSSVETPRTNTSRLIGYVEALNGPAMAKEAYPIPAKGETTMYLPWYMDQVDDAYATAPADDKWETYLTYKNVGTVALSATLTLYSTDGTVLGSYPIAGAPGAIDLFRPTWKLASATTGWAKITVTAGALAGFAEMNWKYGNGTADAILVTGDTSNKMTLPHFYDNVNSKTTYVRIVNTSASSVTVYADFYDVSGTKSGSTVSLSIGANSVIEFKPRTHTTLTEGSIEFSTSAGERVLTGEFQVNTAEEPFTDLNGNHMWNTGETYTDVNGNSQYDPRQSSAESMPLK